MLILLPPSEGKAAPVAGPTLDLDALSLPSLTRTRRRVLDSLVKVSAGNPRLAMAHLGLGNTQADALAANAALHEAPTARADEVYTGVLFSALEPSTLDGDARSRLEQSVLVASGLFGLVRPQDPIAAYRLSGDVALPRLGPVAGLWRTELPAVMDEVSDGGLLVDLRSGTYVALGRPAGALKQRTATMRVLHRHDGALKVVSHFNKATKGRIVRAMMQADVNPGTVDELVDVLSDLGWTVQREGNRLDVVVEQV